MNTETGGVAGMRVWSESTFEELEGEWLGILADESAKVVEWPHLISPLIDEYNQLAAAGLWTHGPDDLLTVIGVSRLELVHSTVLAWLLRPDRPHRLGDRFLRTVASRLLGVAEDEIGSVRDVVCEVQRHDTRADIVVWADGLTVIIENKVDAGEGVLQCERLYQHFAREPGSRFVFLSPSGQAPVTAIGEATGQFVSVSYREIAEALEASIDAMPGSGPGRDVAVNYVRTLRREFGR